MPHVLHGSTGSCPIVSLCKELERKELKVMKSLYRAFPYKYRIRFITSSTAQTTQGTTQHFRMQKLIERGCLEGSVWEGSLKKAGKPREGVPDLGKEVQPVALSTAFGRWFLT